MSNVMLIPLKYQMKLRSGESTVFMAAHISTSVSPVEMVRLSGSSVTNTGAVEKREASSVVLVN
jgi:hypothetical protein